MACVRNKVDSVPVACGDVLRMKDLHIGSFVFLFAFVSLHPGQQIHVWS